MTLKRGHNWAGLAAALLFMVPLAPAPLMAASSQLCLQLEAELAATGKGSPSSAKAREYDRAIAEQERQLSITEADWQRSGCGYGPNGGAGRLCRAIEDTLARMERNYDGLQRERARLGETRSSPVDRQRIQRALDDAGCREPAPKPQEISVPRPAEPAARQERLRTVCVRTADGYFFPMSYGVTKDDFPRDAKACQATCPATEMRLYYHKVPDQNVGDMVSADTNTPYASLPTANLYRNQTASQGSADSCAPTSSPQGTVASVPDQPAVSAPGPIPPAPAQPQTPSIQVLPDASAQPKPDSKPEPQVTAVQPSGKPEVLTSPAQEQAEKAPAIPAVRPPEPAPARPMSDTDKRVRVVGPTFLPAQEGAINLRAPGRKPAP